MPRKRIEASDFSSEMKKIFDQYGDAVNDAVQESIKSVAKEAKNELKQKKTFSGAKTSGAYAKDWSYQVVPLNRWSYVGTVYNKKHYYLTHLLEFGHALRRGGRSIGKGNVDGFEHIDPVNETAQREIVEEITRRIEREG